MEYIYIRKLTLAEIEKTMNDRNIFYYVKPIGQPFRDDMFWCQLVECWQKK